jgi:hypothetical protein
VIHVLLLCGLMLSPMAGAQSSTGPEAAASPSSLKTIIDNTVTDVSQITATPTTQPAQEKKQAAETLQAK